MRLKTFAIQTGARLGDLILPRTCPACGAAVPLQHPQLCRSCATDLMIAVGGDYCRTCGRDHAPHLMIDGRCSACRQGKAVPHFERFVRVGRYAGALRTLILRFKREFILEKMLGHLLADAIQARIDPDDVDLWVPIPTHWRRRLARGFQPTALLTARAAGRYNATPAQVLAMTRYVPLLHAGLSAAQRAAAVKGAFKVRRGLRLAGRSICIVDDVTTSGATLAEARRTLREAGVRRIFAAVLAKTSWQAAPPSPSDTPQTMHPGPSAGPQGHSPRSADGLDRLANPP